MYGSFLDHLGPRGGGICPWPSPGQSVDSQSGSKLPAQHGGGEGEVRNRGPILLNWVPRGSWLGLKRHCGPEGSQEKVVSPGAAGDRSSFA